MTQEAYNESGHVITKNWKNNLTWYNVNDPEKCAKNIWRGCSGAPMNVYNYLSHHPDL